MASSITIPNVGESVSEVTIGKWLKDEGQSVERDEIVLALETDKVNVEVTAPEAGVLRNIKRKAGETAKIGEVVASIEVGAKAAAKEAGDRKDSQSAAKAKGEGSSAKDEGAKDSGLTAPKVPTTQATGGQKSSGSPSRGQDEAAKGQPMPAAARVLHERGLQADDVKGSGRGGRILKEDALGAEAKDQGQGKAAKTQAGPAMPPRSAAPAPASGTEALEQRVPMSPLRRRVAERLLAAQHDAAILTTFNEVDMTAVLAVRKAHQESFVARNGIKLGFMSFFVKAAIDALRAYPEINASIVDGDIVYRRYYDIGVAVGTEKGLVVPVVRRAELLGFADIEQAVADFGQRAKAGKLTLPEMSGGTFTITNGGVFGSLMSTPILNPPQSGILGMHSIVERPIGLNGQIVLRPMMYIALSYDHRIVDGRGAVLFLKRIKECIEAPERMLLEI